MAKIKLEEKQIVILAIVASVVIGGLIGFLIWRVNQANQLSQEDASAGYVEDFPCPDTTGQTCEGDERFSTWCDCYDECVSGAEQQCIDAGKTSPCEEGDAWVEGCNGGCDEECAEGSRGACDTCVGECSRSGCSVNCEGVDPHECGPDNDGDGKPDGYWPGCYYCRGRDTSCTESNDKMYKHTDGNISYDEQYWCSTIQCDSNAPNGAFVIVWIGDNGEWCLDDGSSKECSFSEDRNGDGSVDYRDLDWDCEDKVVTGDPRCLSLSVNGRNSYSGGDTWTVREDDSVSVSTTGRDPDDGPDKVELVFTIGGQPDSFYRDGNAGAVWVEFTSNCGSGNDCTASSGETTFDALADQLMQNSAISSQFDRDDIDENGIMFFTRVYDDTGDPWCTSNPAHVGGSDLGVLSTSFTTDDKCDGDYCLAYLRLGEPDEPPETPDTGLFDTTASKIGLGLLLVIFGVVYKSLGRFEKGLFEIKWALNEFPDYMEKAAERHAERRKKREMLVQRKKVSQSRKRFEKRMTKK